MVEKAGVRELRQNLSKYLDRVKAGVRIEVTERGEPVALLVPLHEDDPVSRLEAKGMIVRRALATVDDLGAPPALESGPTTIELLDEQREDRF